MPIQKSRGQQLAEEWGKEIAKGIIVDSTKELGKAYVKASAKTIIAHAHKAKNKQ